MARVDSRTRVLHATVQTLAAEGYAHTTARAIAHTGGFAPGVIYYYFDDLDHLFAAAAEFASQGRLTRYRAAIDGGTSTVELVRQLRDLHAEDRMEGHVAAVQQLFAAAATPSGTTAPSRLVAQIRAEAEAWRAFTETVLQDLLAGVPFMAALPMRELAATAVATYLGLELLPQVDDAGPESLFDAAERVAGLVDRLRPRARSRRV